MWSKSAVWFVRTLWPIDPADQYAQRRATPRTVKVPTLLAGEVGPTVVSSRRTLPT